MLRIVFAVAWDKKKVYIDRAHMVHFALLDRHTRYDEVAFSFFIMLSSITGPTSGDPLLGGLVPQLGPI